MKERWVGMIQGAGLSKEYEDLFMGAIAGMREVDEEKMSEGYGPEELMQTYRNNIIDTAQARLRDVQNQIVYEAQTGIPANILPEERLASQVYEKLLEDSNYKK